jgi:hypothetical protein
MYAVCKLKAGEWRSKPYTEPGLEAKFDQTVCSLEYSVPTNIMYIEIRDRDKPSMKPLAEGKVTVSEFLDNPNTIIRVPMIRGNDTVGEICFELPSGDASGGSSNAESSEPAKVDPDFPHLRPTCIVCKTSRKNPSGKPYSC